MEFGGRSNSNEEDSLEDDRLRLIFTCCHPSLAPEARIALTLREVCGLTTEEIAKAFLITPRTLAQRIVRAKAKIRETPIPYEVPTPQELPERLGAVLQVIYLVFNEGYSAAAGAEVTRAELTGEAIRLGRLLSDVRPELEVMGLLSLMLLQESPRAARTSPTGELILLDNQDRSLWNRGGESPEVPPLRRLHSSGGHCGCSRREFLRGIHGLAPDYAALRPVASDSAIAGCRTEPRSSRCDVRRSGTGASSYR